MVYFHYFTLPVKPIGWNLCAYAYMCLFWMRVTVSQAPAPFAISRWWPWMTSCRAVGSSRVLRSPSSWTFLSTTFRSTRRIIFPERVLGKRSTTSSILTQTTASVLKGNYRRAQCKITKSDPGPIHTRFGFKYVSVLDWSCLVKLSQPREAEDRFMWCFSQNESALQGRRGNFLNLNHH